MTMDAFHPDHLKPGDMVGPWKIVESLGSGNFGHTFKVEREGIRIGNEVDGQKGYTPGDIELVRTALRLLEFGLPLGDLLSLARDADEAMRGLADRAVELFDEHVRKPIRDTTTDPEGASARMVEAFQELLPAVTLLVSHHFRRVLLEVAEEHIEAPDGAPPDRASAEHLAP